jgi:ATP-dependent protease HslVU (ClpYQ) peptidase subunit
MTAIAGVVHKGKVYLGGDSAGVAGYSMQTRSDPKVFVNNDFVIGFTSSFRMGQILQYNFTPPSPYEGEDGLEYMIRRFVPAVKQALKDGGWATTDDGRDLGGTFLVGWRGVLYYIDSDYQVARMVHDFAACGCGEDMALGSLYSTPKTMKPEDRLVLALSAAAEFSAGVRPPFAVVSA